MATIEIVFFLAALFFAALNVHRHLVGPMPRQALHVHGPARLPIRFKPATLGVSVHWPKPASGRAGTNAKKFFEGIRPPNPHD